MLVRLLLLLVTVPLVELYLLLELARITNVPTTIAVVILTALLGAFLARHQGWMAVWRFREAMRQGRVPASEMADTVMIACAAVMLLTPGLLTDALGFALLIPTSRGWIRRWLLQRIRGKFHVRTMLGPGAARPQHGEPLDATFRPTDEHGPRSEPRIEQR